MRRLSALAVLLAACTVRIPEGGVSCTNDDACPAGWHCLDQGCYSGPGPDAEAADGGAMADASEAGESDAMSGGEPGIAAAGDTCAEQDARACGGHASKLALQCNRGVWRVAETCDDTQRCDTAPGDDLGRCRSIVPECQGQEPGKDFCAGDKIRACRDLVSFIEQACAELQICKQEADRVQCVCKPGTRERGDACADIDECTSDHGGCDALVSCTNQVGSRACGACPSGYTGDGESGCVPRLTDLTLSSGMLSPALSADVLTYYVRLPLGVQDIALTASFPSAADLAIDGTNVASGESWRSQALPLGTTRLKLELVRDGKIARSYELQVTRDDAPVYLKASNPAEAGYFGASVAVSGDTVVVGAIPEASGIGGVNPSQSDGSASYSGAAYVFVRNGSTWVQQARLKASHPTAQDCFGYSVAISGDTIVVGAPYEDGAATGVNGSETDETVSGSGAAFVFVRDGGVWTQQAYLKASNTNEDDTFGESVAIWENTLVVGATYESSNATGVNGNQASNAAMGSGAAYVYTRSDRTWSQQAYLKASNPGPDDSFGNSAALYRDTLVIGAHHEDGMAGGVGSDDAAQDSGAAYVFVHSDGTWSQQAYLKASNGAASDDFGNSVSVWGDTIVVGAPSEDSASASDPLNEAAQDSGAAYVFLRDGTSWTQQAYLKASNVGAGDSFGLSLALVDDRVIVGAPMEDSNATGLGGDDSNDNAARSGAVYGFLRSGGSWAQRAYLKAPNSDIDDNFGTSIAYTGGSIAVGTPFEDGTGTGVDGDPFDNARPNSGAVYVFQ